MAARSTGRTGRTITALLLLLYFGPCLAGTFVADQQTTVEQIQHNVAASVFLSRATFGSTTASIDALALRIASLGLKGALSEWIDLQYALPATSHKATGKQMEIDDREHWGWNDREEFADISQVRYRSAAWWHIAVVNEDQLRQRMAWALRQIFVASGDNSASIAFDKSGESRWLGGAGYYDLMVNHAFGNYRDLLEDVTFHPEMGAYLSHARNPRGSIVNGVQTFPDENFAREVLQLFSIGLNELNIDGTWKTVTDEESNTTTIATYDNDTIKAFARVFTGLAFARRSFYGNQDPNHKNFNEPMVMFDGNQVEEDGMHGERSDPRDFFDAKNYHDFDDKVLLNGVPLSGFSDGAKEIRAALDNIFAHDNVGPFIARRLIQRLVMSNPSKDYIRHVAEKFNNNGKGVRGDFKAVVKAVLLDEAALNSYVASQDGTSISFTSKGTEYSRLREPVLRLTAIFRAFYKEPNYPSNDDYPPTPLYKIGTTDVEYPRKYFMMGGTRLGGYHMGSYYEQAIYEPPHVFNYYLPDYQPPGPVPAYQPSAQIPNSTQFGNLLFAPEFEIMHAVTTNQLANLIRNILVPGEYESIDSEDGIITANQLSSYFPLQFDPPQNVTINVMIESDMSEPKQVLYPQGTAQPADYNAYTQYLNLLLCAGSLSDNTANTIADNISAYESTPAIQVRQAIIGVLLSASCAVQ